ncbi:MAG: hypothetical protein ACOY3H_00525 [Bacillota bacterium]
MQVNLLAPRTHLAQQPERKGPALQERWLITGAGILLLGWLGIVGWQVYSLGQALEQEKAALQQLKSQVEKQNQVLRLAKRIEVQQRVWRELEGNPSNWQGAIAKVESYAGTELTLSRIKFGPAPADWLFQGESRNTAAIEAFQAKLEQDKYWQAAVIRELVRQAEQGSYAFTISQGGEGQ